MHLIESYATNCGVKIDKPFVLEKFYPIDKDKYITIHPYSKPAKNYDHWQTVLNLILPVLEKEGIEIIQIGDKNEQQLQGCHSLAGCTTYGQAAHVIRRGMLHLGCDSFPAHVAGFYNKKSVIVYPNTLINNVKPYWKDEENTSLIMAEPEGKPKFGLDERPKSINKNKPEFIAKEVCRLLELDFDFPYESIHIGSSFGRPAVECIPNQMVNPKQMGVDSIYYRMDLLFNEIRLEQQLSIGPTSIVTDKPISAQLILNNRSRIGEIIYEITEDDDPEFAKFLESNKIKYTMISRLPVDQMNDKKINYIDLEHAAILRVKDFDKEEQDIKEKYDINKLYYMSSRLVLCDGKSYYNEGDIDKDNSEIEFKDSIVKVNDTPQFWRSLDRNLIFEKLD